MNSARLVAPDPPYGRLFIVGAPRSGTTWLQRLMGAHPEIATGQETGLFQSYLQSWVALWDAQLPTDPASWHRLRHKGLPALLERHDFDELMRHVVDQVHGRLVALKPGARVVLDKDPGNAMLMPLIQSLCSDAMFIHIIRDGRDVASSLAAAGTSWGQAWAPTDLESAARVWQRHVARAREDSDGVNRYMEIRYEDLISQGAEALAECFSFCGVAVSQRYCQAALDQLSAHPAGHGQDSGRDPLLWSGEVVRRLGGSPEEPRGFYREGRAGGWTDSWTRAQAIIFDAAAGDLLVSLGYEADRSWARAPRAAHITAWGLRVQQRLRRLASRRFR